VWWVLRVLIGVIDLGDPRRKARMASIARECLSAEGCSLPLLTGKKGKGAVKGAQRFMSNEHVPIDGLRAGLYDVTLEQAVQCRLLVVAFDPTLLDFSGQNQKKDRKTIGDGRGKGYVWLNSAGIDPDTGRFLGPVHQTVVSADGPDDTQVCDYTLGATKTKEFQKLLHNPKQQFLAHALAVHERAPKDLVIVFVADREFDDGLNLRVLAGLPENRHFIIRGNDKRAVQVVPAPWIPRGRQSPLALNRVNRARGSNDEGLEDIYLHDLVQALPLKRSRVIDLDARGRVCADGKGAVHQAALGVGATKICLARKSHRAMKAGISEVPVWLNLVVIRQINAPPPGKKPLEWILLTDLPIETREDIEHVVDLYACRWRIEEFFRTTKDILKVEESELDDAKATARLLFFVTLKAMFLDRLRQAAGVTAGVPPTAAQRQALEHGAQRAIEIERKVAAGGQPPSRLTHGQRATMTLGLIAYRGGWASRNGDYLGNQVLMRGLSVFLHDVGEGRYAWLVQDDATQPGDFSTVARLVGS
jgi:hypothetical protein